jgi:hypothetical protein
MTMREVIQHDARNDVHYPVDRTPAEPSSGPREVNKTGWQHPQPTTVAGGDRVQEMIANLCDEALPHGGVNRQQARELLVKLLRTYPNDPRVVAAKEALEKEDAIGAKKD